MPKVLLGEILGNLIGKNAIFHVKRSLLFYQTTKFAVSGYIFDQKDSRKSKKMIKKMVEIQYIWKFHSLKWGFLLNRGFIE